MRIQIEQDEIERAIRSYLDESGINVEGKDVTMTFSQRRQPTSMLIADVDITLRKVANPVGSVRAVEASEPAPRATSKRAKAAAEAEAAEQAAASSEDKAEGEPDSENTEPGQEDSAAEASASGKVSLFS